MPANSRWDLIRRLRVNTTIELKNITTISDNTRTLVSRYIAHWMAMLLEVVVIFVSSTPNGQFFSCATITFSDRHTQYLPITITHLHVALLLLLSFPNTQPFSFFYNRLHHFHISPYVPWWS